MYYTSLGGRNLEDETNNNPIGQSLDDSNFEFGAYGAGSDLYFGGSIGLFIARTQPLEIDLKDTDEENRVVLREDHRKMFDRTKP